MKFLVEAEKWEDVPENCTHKEITDEDLADAAWDLAMSLRYDNGFIGGDYSNGKMYMYEKTRNGMLAPGRYVTYDTYDSNYMPTSRKGVILSVNGNYTCAVINSDGEVVTCNNVEIYPTEKISTVIDLEQIKTELKEMENNDGEEVRN